MIPKPLIHTPLLLWLRRSSWPLADRGPKLGGGGGAGKNGPQPSRTQPPDHPKWRRITFTEEPPHPGRDQGHPWLESWPLIAKWPHMGRRHMHLRGAGWVRKGSKCALFTAPGDSKTFSTIFGAQNWPLLCLTRPTVGETTFFPFAAISEDPGSHWGENIQMCSAGQ